jgi:hypothetical protein
VIAEGVDTDAINGRDVLGVANGALIYRSGPATGGSGRLTWFDRSGKTLGTVAKTVSTATRACHRTAGTRW